MERERTIRVEAKDQRRERERVASKEKVEVLETRASCNGRLCDLDFFGVHKCLALTRWGTGACRGGSRAKRIPIIIFPGPAGYLAPPPPAALTKRRSNCWAIRRRKRLPAMAQSDPSRSLDRASGRCLPVQLKNGWPLFLPYLAFTTKSGTHFRIGCRWDDVDHYYTFPSFALAKLPPGS